jgi:IstB-like ATP binding protein
LIIDEIGFDCTERTVSKERANLWHKIIDARSQLISTALVTNIDFESWADYLGESPLAMAMMDRIVYGTPRFLPRKDVENEGYPRHWPKAIENSEFASISGDGRFVVFAGFRDLYDIAAAAVVQAIESVFANCGSIRKEHT